MSRISRKNIANPVATRGHGVDNRPVPKTGMVNEVEADALLDRRTYEESSDNDSDDIPVRDGNIPSVELDQNMMGSTMRLANQSRHGTIAQINLGVQGSTETPIE